LNFAFPTRTVQVTAKVRRIRDADGGALGNDCQPSSIFALSVEETGMLAQAAVRHVFAPGETVIRAGDEGSSICRS
jgi:hypothetical protein